MNLFILIIIKHLNAKSLKTKLEKAFNLLLFIKLKNKNRKPT